MGEGTEVGKQKKQMEMCVSALERGSGIKE